ncbi:MAG: hypothetical protein GC168_00270 [Candidatus Hydrogenedens sp.]|nr:hypothetical protein [Candidatus Hydrogenedens sp.]
MSSKTTRTDPDKREQDAMRIEQEFCLDAMSSGEFDDLSDQEWVALCERVAQQQKQANTKAAAAAADA